MNSPAEIRAILDTLETHSPDWAEKLRSELSSMWDKNAALTAQVSQLREALEPAQEPEGEEWGKLTDLEMEVSDTIAVTLSGSNYQPELNLAAHRVVEMVKADILRRARTAGGE